MSRNVYQEYELMAYLGDYAQDYDIDSIVDEATEIDYNTGIRYWKEGIDLGTICKRHEMPE